MLMTAFHGLCMAVADSVPGVSGGTIAFILGFYDRFLDALHGLFRGDMAVRRKSLLYLVKLGLGWGIGMVVCALLLSGLFTRYIYDMSSLFLGLTVASLPFILVAERPALRGGLRHLPFTVLGLALVVGLTALRSGTGPMGSLDFAQLQPLQLVYLFLTGAVAITAMVLPGISGSTILLIAGAYLPAIQAIRRFLSLQLDVLPGLVALGLGVIAGVAVSIHAIRSALRRHRSQMVYLIVGLMLGSLYAIVMGPTSLSQPVAPLDLSTFDPASALLGIAVLLGLEALRKRTERQTKGKEVLLHGSR